MPVELVKGDITTIKAEAIVNAANTSLLGGGGVDGAIHRAAGKELLEECRHIGGCPTGEARITGAYHLPAKYVIHTVGPVYRDAQHGEPEKLSACYRNALSLASERGVRTIAFPAISTGVYHYPVDDACRIAVREVRAYLSCHKLPRKVIFVCFSQEVYNVYLKWLAIDDHHINILVTGKVQGVWFRKSTQEQAYKLGLNGFVRNERDGSVYIEAEGSDDALQSLVEWCGVGSENAIVSKVRVEEGNYRGYQDFVIER